LFIVQNYFFSGNIASLFSGIRKNHYGIVNTMAEEKEPEAVVDGDRLRKFFPLYSNHRFLSMKDKTRSVISGATGLFSPLPACFPFM
jgi:hypothetical protein